MPRNDGNTRRHNHKKHGSHRMKAGAVRKTSALKKLTLAQRPIQLARELDAD